MVSIDGNYLEAGGQILRTSLSLSALLQKPFRIENIRAGRPKPGLQLQHLTAVKAAAEVCGAKVSGAVLGSQEIVFEPSKVRHGSFSFDIGSAGSTTLILQTLLPALAFAGGESTLRITGGTSNPFAPSSWFVEKAFLPCVRKAGVQAGLQVMQFGWYPKGGGVIETAIVPLQKHMSPFNLVGRGKLAKLRGLSIVSNLPLSIAERMKTRGLKNLTEAGLAGAKIELVQAAPAIGEGAEFFLLAEYENCANGFSALGERGKPAEKVAGEAVHNFRQFQATNSCVEEHLADQLLLYAALAKGKSEYSVSCVSRHLLTNAWAIREFLPECEIKIAGKEGDSGTVQAEGIGFSRD